MLRGINSDKPNLHSLFAECSDEGETENWNVLLTIIKYKNLIKFVNKRKEGKLFIPLA